MRVFSKEFLLILFFLLNKNTFLKYLKKFDISGVDAGSLGEKSIKVEYYDNSTNCIIIYYYTVSTI